MPDLRKIVIMTQANYDIMQANGTVTINGVTYSKTDTNNLYQVPGFVASVNGKVGGVILDTDDISDTGTTNKFVSAGDINTWNAKQDTPTIVTDTVNTTQTITAVANTEYYFGTLTALTVTFPTGNTGDLVQINFTGTDNMTVTLGSNVTTLDTTFKANTRYSITAQKDTDLWWLLCVEREITNNA